MERFVASISFVLNLQLMSSNLVMLKDHDHFVFPCYQGHVQDFDLGGLNFTVILTYKNILVLNSEAPTLAL